ncbi:MAG: glutamate--tRNA ligase [Oscillospiraceae bacterium]|nr:glutamate--tRNA ligase [Oscillospiraceae bacterium]
MREFRIMNELRLRLSQAIFGNSTPDPEELELRYPPRALPEGAFVTRLAPSPTGFLHIGNLFGAFADFLAAARSGGVFFLRLEDTDKKREVAQGAAVLLEGLRYAGILPDEGVTAPEEERGAYGPYTQSKRKWIYHAFARQLLEAGLAYPCFCSAEALDELRARQEQAGVNKGYYGKWARCRDLPLAEQARRVEAGEPYTLRLRSPGRETAKITVRDLVRGKLELPENIMDAVLLKADGVPTYHFAHAVDDHLMRVTHVIRGDEWIASLPLHIQLFELLGFRPPHYAHTALIMKEENGGRRKLSKRKDPEARVSWFAEQGYPAQALREYLLTLLNSNFEDWRRANPAADLAEFPFELKKLSPSGALFDLVKLEDVSKTVISRMTAEEACEQALVWAGEYDPALAALMEADKPRARAMLGLDRGGRKPRKDIARWNQLRETFGYFYEELYAPLPCEQPDSAAILRAYQRIYDPADDKETWFARLKSICEPLGYSPDVKAFKAAPEAWKGHVGDVSGVIRWAVTSRANTPDLWAVMRVLGEETVRARLEAALAACAVR